MRWSLTSFLFLFLTSMTSTSTTYNICNNNNNINYMYNNIIVLRLTSVNITSRYYMIFVGYLYKRRAYPQPENSTYSHLLPTSDPHSSAHTKSIRYLFIFPRTHTKYSDMNRLVIIYMFNTIWIFFFLFDLFQKTGWFNFVFLWI